METPKNVCNAEVFFQILSVNCVFCLYRAPKGSRCGSRHRGDSGEEIVLFGRGSLELIPTVKLLVDGQNPAKMLVVKE